MFTNKLFLLKSQNQFLHLSPLSHIILQKDHKIFETDMLISNLSQHLHEPLIDLIFKWLFFALSVVSLLEVSFQFFWRHPYNICTSSTRQFTYGSKCILHVGANKAFCANYRNHRSTTWGPSMRSVYPKDAFFMASMYVAKGKD